MTEYENDRKGNSGTYASSPCFMHELGPGYMGLAVESDARQSVDVTHWRKAERQRLIKERLGLPLTERHNHSKRIITALDGLIGDVSGCVVSVYWPIRGEPDLRHWIERVSAHGGTCVLPVVIERRAPLAFRTWRPGARLERGVWNIPIPVEGKEATPDIIIAPVVGFDRNCYRLGYGGGFYDRTLAAMPSRHRVIGVGYVQAAIQTIYPQPHDIPMDAVVTEDGIASM